MHRHLGQDIHVLKLKLFDEKHFKQYSSGKEQKRNKPQGFWNTISSSMTESNVYMFRKKHQSIGLTLFYVGISKQKRPYDQTPCKNFLPFEILALEESWKVLLESEFRSSPLFSSQTISSPSLSKCILTAELRLA